MGYIYNKRDGYFQFNDFIRLKSVKNYNIASNLSLPMLTLDSDGNISTTDDARNLKIQFTGTSTGTGNNDLTSDTAYSLTEFARIIAYQLSNMYSKNEVDNLVATGNSSLDWKASVETYDDLAVTYADAEDGWTVNVKDDDITYRFDGEKWIPISSNAIPLATNILDGRMSASDKTKLDGIPSNANYYEHPTTHPASMIVQDDNRQFVSKAEKELWNQVCGEGGKLTDYLPISGGSMTGPIQTKGHYEYALSNISTSIGYIRIGQIKISEAHQNSPITVKLVNANVKSLAQLNILFKDSDTTDPELSNFSYSGSNIHAYMVKSAISTWDLMLSKTTENDIICIIDCIKDEINMSGTTITWLDGSSILSELPTGTVEASALDTGMVVDWDNVLDKPSTYTPSSHTHVIKDITNLANAEVLYSESTGRLFNSKNFQVGNTLKSFNGTQNLTWTLDEIGCAPSIHTHTISQITDIANASVNYATTAGTANGVEWANITNKVALPTNLVNGDGLYSVRKTLSTASGEGSNSLGHNTKTDYDNQTAIGKYNDCNESYAFMIGAGSSDTERANAFSVTWEGSTNIMGCYGTNGADYAERFEWEDGNLDNEDRVGYFVAIEGDKIIKGSSYYRNEIIGIVSATPSIIGDSNDDEWHGKYKRDDFGRKIPVETIDNTGHKNIVYELSEDYDPLKKYIPRSQRKEWTVVGLFGKILVRDDGTCLPNYYCTCNDDGIATHCNVCTPHSYRVLKRVAPNVVQILFNNKAL